MGAHFLFWRDLSFYVAFCPVDSSEIAYFLPLHSGSLLTSLDLLALFTLCDVTGAWPICCLLSLGLGQA